MVGFFHAAVQNALEVKNMLECICARVVAKATILMAINAAASFILL